MSAAAGIHCTFTNTCYGDEIDVIVTVDADGVTRARLNGEVIRAGGRLALDARMVSLDGDGLTPTVGESVDSPLADFVAREAVRSAHARSATRDSEMVREAKRARIR